MKEDPELIDLFAMLIAQGLAVRTTEMPKNIAEYSYILANEMMQERKNWIGKNNE